MRRFKFKLWLSFLTSVIVTMTIFFVSTGLFAYVFFRDNFLIKDDFVPWLPILSFFFTAVCLSAVLLLFISRHFFVPIEELISALKQVASGDFKVRLPEGKQRNEIEEMNLNFNKMVRELNSIEMLQSDFIQSVSHEFKTPLASIEGYTFLLNAADLPEDLHEYTVRILNSTRQLSSLTGNILNLSKLENQQIVSEKSLFSLDEQIRQAVISMEPLWSEKNLDIDIDLPEITYFGNEQLIFQVWTNLFSNAIKFTPDRGSIVVRLRETDSHVYVEFRDSGIGMSAEIRKHIFDKFYQGETNRNSEGNGLGLSLVKKIVTLCGGAVAVDSRPGHGSVFYITLPRQAA